MIRTVFILYFNQYFRSCFCQENPALWIILSVFLWMLTSKATEMKAALQRRSVQDFPVNETSMKDQNKETSQMRQWYPQPGRSSFVHHLEGCWKGQLATSSWGSLVAMLARPASQLCFCSIATRCWSPQGHGRNLTPCCNTLFFVLNVCSFFPWSLIVWGPKGLCCTLKCALLPVTVSSWIESDTLIYC